MTIPLIITLYIFFQQEEEKRLTRSSTSSNPVDYKTLATEGKTQATEKPKKPSKPSNKKKDKKNYQPNIEERIQELKKLNSEKDAELQELKEEVSDLKEEIENMKLSNIDSNENIEEIMNTNQELAEENMKLKEENDELKKLLEEAKKDQSEKYKEHYEKLWQRYTQETTYYEEKNKQMESEIQDHKDEIEQLIKANDQYQEYVNEMRERNEFLQNRTTNLSQKVQKQRDELQTAKRRHEEMTNNKKDPVTKRQKIVEKQTYASKTEENVQQAKQTYESKTEIMKSTKITTMTPPRPHQYLPRAHHESPRPHHEPQRPRHESPRPHHESQRPRHEPPRSTNKQSDDDSDDDNIQVTIDLKPRKQPRKARIFTILELTGSKINRQLNMMTNDKDYAEVRGPTTIEELKQITEDDDSIKRITKADQVIIMCGLRDIRNGTPGATAAKRVNDIARELGRETLTQIRLCELPMTKYENVNEEIDRYNKYLRDNNRYTFQMLRVKRLSPKETYENDHHLTDLAAERIAKDINENAIPAVVAENYHKRVTEHPRKTIGRLIGKYGKNKQELEKTYGVQIAARNIRLIIKGNEENVRRAAEEVDYQIESYERETYERSRESSPY